VYAVEKTSGFALISWGIVDSKVKVSFPPTAPHRIFCITCQLLSRVFVGGSGSNRDQILDVSVLVWLPGGILVLALATWNISYCSVA